MGKVQWSATIVHSLRFITFTENYDVKVLITSGQPKSAWSLHAFTLTIFFNLIWSICTKAHFLDLYCASDNSDLTQVNRKGYLHLAMTMRSKEPKNCQVPFSFKPCLKCTFFVNAYSAWTVHDLFTYTSRTTEWCADLDMCFLALHSIRTGKLDCWSASHVT